MLVPKKIKFLDTKILPKNMKLFYKFFPVVYSLAGFLFLFVCRSVVMCYMLLGLVSHVRLVTCNYLFFSFFSYLGVVSRFIFYLLFLFLDYCLLSYMNTFFFVKFFAQNTPISV